MSLGQPFTPHRPLTLVTASDIRRAHPGLCGLRVRFKSPFVPSTIPFAWGADGVTTLGSWDKGGGSLGFEEDGVPLILS